MFRAGNERLQQVADPQFDGRVPLPFLCECADVECLGRIELTTNDYAAIHLDRHQYVILPGHATIEGEEIVEEDAAGGYFVVSKN